MYQIINNLPFKIIKSFSLFINENYDINRRNYPTIKKEHSWLFYQLQLADRGIICVMTRSPAFLQTRCAIVPMAALTTTTRQAASSSACLSLHVCFLIISYFLINLDVFLFLCNPSYDALNVGRNVGVVIIFTTLNYNYNWGKEICVVISAYIIELINSLFQN